MTLIPSTSAEVGSMLAILPLTDNKGYSAFFRLYQTHILPQLLSSLAENSACTSDFDPGQLNTSLKYITW